MKEQITIQNTLREKFTEIRLNNPAFSLRAFARKLRLNSGALSTILNGKRRISYKLASKIADRLYLDPQERAQVLESFPKKNQNTLNGASIDYLQLTADQFRIISEWYHFAILSLINTSDFKSNPTWIAKRLGIGVKVAKDAIHRLLRIGLIERDRKKNFKRKTPNYRTTDDIKNISLQKAHAQSLELAKESLQRVDVEKRDFTAITMAIDPNKFSQAKEKVRKFQDELSQFLENGERKEVYKLCIQLFPLTKDKGESP